MRIFPGPAGPSTLHAATTKPRDATITGDHHDHQGLAGETGEHGRLELALI
jgi:hypothetical protein